MNMKRKLAYYGNPIFRRIAKPIEEMNDWVKELAFEMIAFVQEHRGIGLSAPQLGESVRLFVICVDKINEDGTFEKKEPQVFINPKLTDPLKEKATQEEATFSLPGLNVPVTRPIAITVEATNLEGEVFVERREGFAARVAMHENDYLNGVLPIDRMPKDQRKKIEPQLKVMKARYPS